LQNKIRPWDSAAYQALLKGMESIPAGLLRDQAIERIGVLDCANTALASCDPTLPPPAEAADWRKRVEGAGVNDPTYADALARFLKLFVCSGEEDAISILRGPGFANRLYDAGPAASDLIANLMNKDSKDCPVSAALTDDDRARLLGIKQQIEDKGK
jgi:hypothetical protein